ncbi:MAG TPA: group I intron-associated PD-(D/E)XK endonuclease, partial [Sporichthya sp.]|nr:group I intron-associated PD-(D/E)XK endonuclease [Sporichthya sp.]
VIADLMKHEIGVALPMSEHLPFDLIAIAPDGQLSKVSVKFRTMRSDGTVGIPAKSAWADRHGVHTRSHAPGDYDAVALYCPNTDSCYYVPAAELRRNMTALRILETRNHQQVRVRMAQHFTDPQQLFRSPRSSAG